MRGRAGQLESIPPRRGAIGAAPARSEAALRALGAQIGNRGMARRLLRSPADARWLSGQVGNRRMARLLAREPTDAPPREPGSGRVLPRVRVERDPRVANRLLFRFGGEIVGTLDVSGAGGGLEDLQVRDFTQNHAGEIDTLEIEVRYPPGAKLSWDVWRHSIAKTKARYGIGAVNLKRVELRPPYKRDVEIQVWPPLGYELPGIERPQTTERERKESEERRRSEQEEHGKTVKLVALLEERLKEDYARYEAVQSGGVAGVVSELLGDARYPLPDEWNEVYRYLFEAQKAVDAGDSHGARVWMKRAEKARKVMAARISAFENDRETGAERAVKGLSAIATVGETAAHLIPGPVGRVLSLGYELVKPAPRSMEEAADRLRGALGLPGEPNIPKTPRTPTAPGKVPRGGAHPEPTTAPKGAPTTKAPHPDEPTTVRPAGEPDPPAVKPPQEPRPPPVQNKGQPPTEPAPGTGEAKPPPPRRQQQQQHQQPGQRLPKTDPTPEQKPAPARQRQQQQQHQQQQTGPVTPRPPTGSLLERARTAGVEAEIDGPLEVFAYGTTQKTASDTVVAGGFSTGGGNFGGRRYVATNLETGRVFALRRVTQETGSSPGVVGIALPKSTVDALKQQKLLHFEQMTDPPPELANSRGQWIIEPGAIDAINADGFFFLLE